VALLPLLAETLPMVEAQAAARGLAWQVEVPALAVLADPVRLKQVLLNLLTNAIKYNRDAGQIQIRAALIGDRVLLRVRDSGIGMSPDRIVDAFEPFQRLRPHAPGVEGVGIGLAIVKTLMQRMGGSVGARSEPGVGSEFELVLQAAELPAPAAERLAELVRSDEPEQASLLPPPERCSTDQPRVLYIEDNPVNMMIVAELVARRGGLSFVGAHDGRTGVEAARRERPDLILLDMHLPDGHGHQVMARLRADPLTRAIPCVALSANALPADIEAALQLGFSDYWTKPLDFKAFLQALDALFGPPEASP
jgi:CheY-like chemotaxis protein